MLGGYDIPISFVNSLHHQCRLTLVRTGQSAVFKAQRAIFDAAVIFNTGEEMDEAETIFNLSDLNPRMKLILVCDVSNEALFAVPERSLERLVPNTTIMNLQQLRNYFESGDSFS